MIHYHHEKFDGSGYPVGLKGEEIPLNARIFAIVDVFDALMSRRSYKEPFELQRALAVLEEGRGSHFDPKLLDLFLRHVDEWYRSIGQARYLDLSRRLSVETRQYFFNASMAGHKLAKSPHKT